MKSSLLSKAGAVLEAVCSLDRPVAIKELTGVLKMPLPTVSRLCADLVAMRLLEKTDYHHLIPGITLIRFGHRARKLSPLITTLQQPVNDYVNLSGLNAAVYGFDRDCFFHIYSREHNSPVQDTLRYTGAFIVLLAAAGVNAERAQELVLARYPDMPVTEKVICDREFSVVEQQKILTRVAPNRKWMISMPFYYENIACCLSFYGQGKEESTVEAELFEISKVLSRIRTGLDRIGKGEE
ncbi:MAG: helix-turn-helix domain-containing protein [Lentisphaeria bacterium]|nr:helix-turn-helix domain-containing protein [Lentisphaeria bacterium]